MNTELDKIGFDFELCWERICKLTGWKKQTQLASFLGIKPPSVSDAKSRGFISLEWLYKVAQHYNASTDWLASGKGPVKLGDAEAFDWGTTFADPNAQWKHADAVDLHKEYVLVPRYNVRVSAGGGSVVESEQVVDHLAFKSSWIHEMHLTASNLLLVNSVGDSMFPTIKEGDLLLVDKGQQDVRDDAIYVLQNDGALVAKRLQRFYDGSIQIKSDNKLYDEQTVPADRVNILKIIGRVVWGGGKM